MQHNEGYYNTNAVMERFSVSRRTVANWRESKGFPAPEFVIRDAYFCKQKVHAWEAQQIEKATKERAAA